MAKKTDDKIVLSVHFDRNGEVVQVEGKAYGSF